MLFRAGQPNVFVPAGHCWFTTVDAKAMVLEHAMLAGKSSASEVESMPLKVSARTSARLTVLGYVVPADKIKTEQNNGRGRGRGRGGRGGSSRNA